MLQGWEGLEGCILERMLVSVHTLISLYLTIFDMAVDKDAMVGVATGLMETSPYKGCGTGKAVRIK